MRENKNPEQITRDNIDQMIIPQVLREALEPKNNVEYKIEEEIGMVAEEGDGNVIN